MRALFLSLILLLVSVWLGLQIYHDPGYALFSYGSWSVEMPLWLALLGTLVLFICLCGIKGLINRTGGLSKRLSVWSHTRKAQHVRSETNRGLVQLLEGNWQKAESHLIKVARKSDMPLINYLAAARAAQKQEKYDKRDDYLRLAHQGAPEAQVAIDLTQAELQLQHQQWEQALATLQHLRTIAPCHRYGLDLLKRVYLKLGEWEKLSALLPTLQKYKVDTKTALSELTQQIYTQWLTHLIAQNGDQSIQAFWQDLPGTLRRDPTLLGLYCPYLITQNQADRAQTLLQDALKRSLDDSLVALYAKIPASDPQQQLRVAEKWLKDKPHNPALLLALGEICLQQQWWDKADQYLQACVEIQPSRAAYLALAQLSEALGRTEQALSCYHQALA